MEKCLVLVVRGCTNVETDVLDGIALGEVGSTKNELCNKSAKHDFVLLTYVIYFFSIYSIVIRQSVSVCSVVPSQTIFQANKMAAGSS